MAILASVSVRNAAPALSACQNTPIRQWSGNNHLYRGVCVPSGINWNQAKNAAEARGGYLVALTSAGENNFVFSMIDGSGLCSTDPWIGAFQPSGSSEPAGGWKWVTGQPMVFKSWNGGEPNNSGGDENVAQFNSCNDPVWNDKNGNDDLDGYVMEWTRAAGDVNCDGVVDVTDAILILQYISGMSPTPPEGCPAIGQGSGDVNCDGVVNIFDALIILQHLGGFPTSQTMPCAPVGPS